MKEATPAHARNSYTRRQPTLLRLRLRSWYDRPHRGDTKLCRCRRARTWTTTWAETFPLCAQFLSDMLALFPTRRSVGRAGPPAAAKLLDSEQHQLVIAAFEIGRPSLHRASRSKHLRRRMSRPKYRHRRSVTNDPLSGSSATTKTFFRLISRGRILRPSRLEAG